MITYSTPPRIGHGSTLTFKNSRTLDQLRSTFLRTKTQFNKRIRES